MKKIKVIVVLVFSVLSLTQKAQQTVLFNTYNYDLMQLNIANIGRTCFEANLNYRTQWLGVKETPKLYQLNAALALGKSNGIGIKVAQQNIGLLQVTNATLGYAYRVKLNEKSKLHLGLGAAWQQNNFNASKAVVLDNNDLSIGANQNQQRNNNLDLEAGALFLGDKLTAGFSALHLYNTNNKLEATSYKVNPQVNVVLAYKFNKGKAVEVEPWLVNRYTANGNNQPEGLLNFKFKQLITIGGGYRLNYGILALAGFELGKFKVAYSFDYGLGNSNVKNLGSSHQILLGFDLCKNKIKKSEPIAETPVKQEPVVIKEEPKKEEPVIVKEEPKKEEPVKEEPKIDLELEKLKKQDAALVEVNKICEGFVFDVNKTNLSTEKQTDLDKIANLLKNIDLKVNILGYASKDGNPIKNKALSQARATYVKPKSFNRIL